MRSLLHDYSTSVSHPPFHRGLSSSFFPSPLSGPEFEWLEVCLGTPEGTGCLWVGCRGGDLRPSDISSVLLDSTHNLHRVWQQYGCEGAELLICVWRHNISCFSLHIKYFTNVELELLLSGFRNEDPPWIKECKHLSLCKAMALTLLDRTPYEQAEHMYCMYSGEQLNQKVICDWSTDNVSVSWANWKCCFIDDDSVFGLGSDNWTNPSTVYLHKRPTHIYSINPLVYEMAKNNLKNADHSFTEPKITPSDFFYGPANGPKLKNSSFTIINDEKSSN